MTPTAPANPPLPRWVVRVGSGIIVFHVFSLAILVLAAPSGQWATPFGSTMAEGPRFALIISDVTARHYLRPLHMTHNYHFASNAPEMPQVFFEVRLKDAKGHVVKTLKFPNENANFWLRHRQRLLAQRLGDDQPVQAPQGEQVLPKGQSYPTVTLWMPAEGDPVLRLKQVSQLDLPRNQPLSRPSDWSRLLANAYLRHLCREHGAASAELIRHSRNPVHPFVLFFTGPLPPDTFQELVCNFGEYRP
jgi:hypothetical protein